MSTWYSPSLFFESVHSVTPAPPSLWEEIVILIEADEDAAAQRRADEIGRQKEHEYVVAAPINHVVRWRFVKTERVYEIDDPVPRDGTELFSRFLKPEEASSLLTPSKNSNAQGVDVR